MALISKFVVEPIVLRHRLDAGDKAIKLPIVVFSDLLRLTASIATHGRLPCISRLLAC